MAGAPLQELNLGIEAFFCALRRDPVASRAAEVAIVAYASDAELVLDFQALSRFETSPRIHEADGATNMAAGISLALQALERAKAAYRKSGVDYHQPFLVLMSDGVPNVGDYQPGAARCRELEAQRKLVVFPVGIGADADMATLGRFSEKRPPMKLSGLDFTAFFAWLSQSVAQVSRSTPGQSVKLPNPNGWCQI